MPVPEPTEIHNLYTLAWAVITTIATCIFGWAYWSLRKEFVTKKQYTEDREGDAKEVNQIDKRLQSVEQTYATSKEVKTLSDSVTKLQTELHKDMSHIQDTLKRIERPLNLIVEAKINGK